MNAGMVVAPVLRIKPCELEVRPLEPTDVAAATTVISQAFRQPDGSLAERYRPAVIGERLTSGLTSQRPTRSRFLIVEHRGALVGIGGYSRETWSPIAWSLYLAAVRPDLQGNGIGHLLIEQRLTAIERATVGAGVILTSARRPHSFEVLGFQALRKMPHGPTLMVREFVGTAEA